MAKTATKETTNKEVTKKSTAKETAKVQPLTLEDIADKANNGKDDVIACEWRGLKMKIKPVLNTGEVIFFCDDVVEAVLNENADAYKPEIMDMAIRSEIVLMYTDLELPKDASKLSYILYGTDLVNFVIEHINIDQYEMMVNAIKTRAHYIAEANVKMIEQKIDEVYSTMLDFVDKFAGMFNGISEQDVQNVISAVADGGIDEEKLVKAYIENTTKE